METIQVDPLNFEQIEVRVKNCPRLPSLGTVNHSLLELLNEDQGGTAQLAEVIRRDPSLTARLLRLVNSVYYGLTNTVNSVEEAVLYLGVTQIRQLAMVTPILEDLKRLTGNVAFPWRDFWLHCIATAYLTTEIVGSPQNGSEEVNYVAGLIHDVGKIAMAASFPEHFEVIYLQRKGEKDLRELEKEVLGMDHAELGALYLSKHNLPKVMVEAAKHHHDPKSYIQHSKVVAAVQIANLLAHHANIGSSGNTAEVSEDDWIKASGWKILYPEKNESAQAIIRTDLKQSLKGLPSLLMEMV